jgi:hypothetical protein
MGENEENFRDRLIKMAQMVEIAETIFPKTKSLSINIELNEDEFNSICYNLNKNIKEERAIISIGEVDFIFLKK